MTTSTHILLPQLTPDQIDYDSVVDDSVVDSVVDDSVVDSVVDDSVVDDSVVDSVVDDSVVDDSVMDSVVDSVVTEPGVLQTYFGSPVPASSFYFSPKSSSQTITVDLMQFVGKLDIQATLVRNPTADDWVTMISLGDLLNPLTERKIYNLIGNYVWFRANVTGFDSGVIVQVKVSYK